MTARQQALKDIKNDLRQESKAFIAYRTDLNPLMRSMVRDYIHEQKRLSQYSKYNPKDI